MVNVIMLDSWGFDIGGRQHRVCSTRFWRSAFSICKDFQTML